MSKKQNPWSPSLFKKQHDLLRLCRIPDGRRKYILATGGRWAGRTVACLHAVLDHCWNTKNARVCILVPSLTVGADCGVWGLLTEVIAPEWIAGDFGMVWASGGTPRQSAVTKQLFCILKNKHGGESRITLNSMKDEREFEREFKGRYFTMVLICQAEYLTKRESLTVLLQTLRGHDVPDDGLVILADATPPTQNPTESFWYKDFFEFRKRNPRTLSPNEANYQKSLHVIEFVAVNNPYLAKAKREQVEATYAHDADLHRRYWLGKWK